MKTFLIMAGLLVAAFTAGAVEYEVAMTGSDANAGSRGAPFRTIQRAAEVAGPGDVVTVHAGVYREEVDPQRGGTSERRRIVYQAAKGEKVVITGSEVVKGWVRVTNETWRVSLPNSFFGAFNPYADLIHGDWFSPLGREHHTGAVYVNGVWLVEAAHLDEVLQPMAAGKPGFWFGVVTNGVTSIWAQFPGVNPNDGEVEINVRQSVFTPSRSGINYITVRGFDLRDAATPWAPPTAKQVGVITASWCKGWIIEDNEISYSSCCGVALGKYGDGWDNRAESAEGYVGTLTRALTNGWNEATVGSHVVRNNVIHDCEQTGIVGSLGCSFSTIEGNEIYNIHVRGLFSGAEMAGIKFHGAIDVKIAGNHIYQTTLGLWLDWMGQGAQVTGNLFHDNAGGDAFFEMQHGPILVANNLFLSRPGSLAMNSQGIALAQNLILGGINSYRGDTRVTPYERAHSTAIGGMLADSSANDSGDDRFYNNVMVGPCDLRVMEGAALPCFAGGNVFVGGAGAATFDASAVVVTNFDAGVSLVRRGDGWYLTLNEDKEWRGEAKRWLVTTALLGKARITGCAYENADGSPVRLDRDYFGRRREGAAPFPGPFEGVRGGREVFKVWPKGGIFIATDGHR